MQTLAAQIQQLGGVSFALVVCALIAAAAICAAAAYRYLRRARLIEDTPTQKARSAAQGYAELSGRVQALMDASLRAPLSGLACLWYRYRVEQRVTDSRNRVSWRTIEHGVSDRWFKLVDETGAIAVDPRGADVDTPAQYRWEGDFVPDLSLNLSAEILSFVSARNFNGRYRLTEQRIHVGERLYTLGLLKNVQSHQRDAGVRGEVSALLREWKQDQAALKARFDVNHDDRIDQDEWVLAQEAAQTAVLQRAPTAPALNVLCADTDARPYILSTYPPVQLARRYRYFAALAAVATAAVAAGGVWAVNVRLH